VADRRPLAVWRATGSGSGAGSRSPTSKRPLCALMSAVEQTVAESRKRTSERSGEAARLRPQVGRNVSADYFPKADTLSSQVGRRQSQVSNDAAALFLEGLEKPATGKLGRIPPGPASADQISAGTIALDE